MKRFIFAAVISVGIMSQAFGAMLSEGTRQLNVYGSLDETEEVNFTLGAKGGYFIMDNVEVGAGADWGMIHGGDVMNIGLSGFGEFNFVTAGMPNVIPYAGASVGLRYSKIDLAGVDESDSVVEFVGWGGVKYFVVENLAIGTALRLFAATDDIYIDDAPGTLDNTNWDIVMSTSFYF